MTAASIISLSLGLSGLLVQAGCLGQDAVDDTGGGGPSRVGPPAGAHVIDLASQPHTEKAASWFYRLLEHADNAFLSFDDGTHINVNDRACFMIGAASNFGNDSCWTLEQARTRIDANGFYKGTARDTGQDDQSTRLYWGCTAYSNFQTNPGGVAWVSNSDEDGILDNGACAGSNDWPFCTGNRTSSTTTNMWWGDAISWLGGLGGSFQNYGTDFAYVPLSHDPFKPNKIQVGSGGCNGIWNGVIARAHSFFVGVPSAGKLVTLMGINSSNNMIRGHANSSGTFQFAVSTEGGFSSRFMTMTDLGFCGMTRFSGHFVGNGEKLRIFAEDTSTGKFWKVSASKLSGDGVSGSSTCISYDQRT